MLKASDLKAAKEAILFAGLSDELAECLLERATVRICHRGETLFLQGDAAETVFVVLEGWIKLYRVTPTGAEAVVGVFTRGRSFGEAVAFKGDRYPVAAEAVTDGRLLLVPASFLLEMMRERPEIGLAMLSATYSHLHFLVEQLEQLKAHTGAQRVAEFLLDLCECESGTCTITLPYDKTLIAGRLGMQPQSLSRAFNRLKEQGVKVSHNQATIADIEHLQEFVMQDRSGPWKKVQ